MLGFILVTQIPGAVVVAGVLLVRTFGAPDVEASVKQIQTRAFQTSPEFAAALWPGFLVAQLLGILFAWLALRLVVGKEWPRRVALRRPSLAHFLLTLLILPAVMLVGQGADEIAQKLRLPTLVNLEDFMVTFSHWPWWLGILLIGFGPGISEELWCRAFLGRGLVGSHGVVLGVLLTSVLFGIMHLEPRQVFYAPVIGMVLHFVYLTTRSLWMPMFLHLLNNSLTFLLARSQDRWAKGLAETLEQATKNHPGLIYGAALILLGTVGWAMYQSRTRLAAADGNGPPPWRPAYPGVEYPPPASGTVVARPLPNLWSVILTVSGCVAFVGAWYLAI
jgi:membrane protease YdiL (CAAX protease family)